MIRRLLLDTRASSAAEFGLVLPLLLLVIFGVIDAGRFLWEYNQAEKATQEGTRVAIVTSSIPTGLINESYVGKSVTLPGGTTAVLTQGDVIPASALGEIKCTSSGCTCVTAPCPSSLGTIDMTTFNAVLVPRMRNLYPKVNAAHVELIYRGSGLGFAGDPNGMEIAPILTVRLVGSQAAPLKFVPITTLLMASLDMPSFSTSLPVEDASGSQSY